MGYLTLKTIKKCGLQKISSWLKERSL